MRQRTRGQNRFVEEKPLNKQMDRRSFLSLGAMSSGILLTDRLMRGIAEDASAKAGTIVETNSGKIRGLQQNGVFSFRGISYGESTAGDLRFMPPAKTQPWKGVREAFEL